MISGTHAATVEENSSWWNNEQLLIRYLWLS